MNLFSGFLKPSPHIKEIEDPSVVKKNYRYWRIRIFYGMFIGYIFYYFTRKSFTFVMPYLIDQLGFTKSQLGLLGTVLYVSYGISKFVSGIMSDQSNPRYFMALGLIITGLTNIFFGLSSSLWLFAIFWGINGWFQGWGWPPCARLLTHWYSHTERGIWWSFWSTSHNVGGFLVPIFIGFAGEHFGWRAAMYFPGVSCIIIGFFLINRLRDTPQSLGLPSIEKFKKDYPGNDISSEEEEKELSTKEILWEHVLNNKWIWILSIASFFIYVLRMAINDWTALLLIETKHYSYVQANFCVSIFELGGLVGMLVAGWFSDKILKGRRGPANVLFSLGMLIFIVVLYFLPNASLLVDHLLLFLIGFFLFGPQMLIGLAAAELAHKKAAGTASGFTGWFAYFGAAATGYPLGKIAQDWGWNGYFIALIVCGILSLLLFLPTWNAHPVSCSKPK